MNTLKNVTCLNLVVMLNVYFVSVFFLLLTTAEMYLHTQTCMQMPICTDTFINLFLPPFLNPVLIFYNFIPPQTLAPYSLLVPTGSIHNLTIALAKLQL